MNFETTSKNKKTGKFLGFIITFIIFSIILFIILKILNRIPDSWGFFHITQITLMLSLTGVLIRKIIYY